MSRPRSTLPPPSLDALFQRIESERNRQDALRVAWLNRPESEYMADTLGKRYQQAPWLPSDAIAAATFAGVDDAAFGALAEAGGYATMENGRMIESAQVAALLAFANPFSDEFAAFAEEKLGSERIAEIDAEVAERMAAKVEESGFSPGGIWQTLSDNPVTRVAGDIAEDVGGVVPGAVRTGVKGAVRTGVGGLQSGYEAVQNAAASRVHGITDLGGALLEGDLKGAAGAAGAAFGYQAFMPSTYQATSAGQTVSQLVETGEVDAGSGFFTGGTVQKAQAQRARDVRGTIDGQAWTIGRATASTVLQPGSQPYNWVSGVIDAASAVGLDPANYAGAGVAKARAGHVSRSAGPEWRSVVEAAWGALPAGSKGVRDAVYVPRAVRALASVDGRKVVKAVSEESSPTRQWLAHSKKIDPGDGLALALAKTDAAVIQAYGQAFTTGRLLNLPSPGHWSGNMPTGTVTSRLADRHRIFGMMPSTSIDPDDPARSMQNIYDTLGNVGITGDVRVKLMDDWVYAKYSGKKGNEFDAVHKISKAMGQTLKDAGAPADLVDKALDWRGAYGRQTQYLADEFADGISSDFLGKKGPTRLVEAMSHGIQLMDPKEIRGARAWTSNVGRITKKTGLNAPKSMIEALQQDWWKPSVLWRPAYFPRVNGEEVVRTLLGGSFRHATDYLLATVGHGFGDDLLSSITRRFGGRYGDDLAGDPLDITEYMDDIDNRIDAAHAAGNVEEGQRLIAERVRIEDEILGGAGDEYGKALVGRIRGKARGISLRDDYVAEYGIRTGNWLKVTKDQGEWVDGLANELAMMHSDRILRRVANGGLLESDLARASKFTDEPAEGFVRLYRGTRRGGPDGEWVDDMGLLAAENEVMRSVWGRWFTPRKDKAQKFVGTRGYEDRALHYVDVPEDVYERIKDLGDQPRVVRDMGMPRDEVILPEEFMTGVAVVGDAPQRFRPGLDGIEDWILANGDGIRDELSAFYPKIDFTDPENVKTWVRGQIADVEHHTGMNGAVREMVATGRLGELAAFTPVQGKLVAGDNVRDLLRSWREADDAPAWVRWEQSIYDPNASTLLKRGKQIKDEFNDFFFGRLYGKTSDYLARAPTFRKQYWTHIADDGLASLLSPEEAQKALRKLEKAKLPSSIKDKVRVKLQNADGTETLKDIDRLAKGYALDDTNKLLMDASRKSQFFDVWKIVFPFGEAWREVLTTWAKIAYKRPEVANSLRKTVVAGREGDPDNNGQGWFYKNAFGEEVFAYPASGALAEALTGVNVGMEGSLLGLSLGTQIMPGIGPIASFGVASLVPDSPTWDGLSEMLFPYGEPGERDLSPLEIALPGWAQKVGAAVPGVQDWFGLDNANRNAVWGNTYMEVYSALAASGDYDMKNPQDLNRLDDDARNKAKVISFMRGIVQATAPASPGLAFKVATLQGDVLVPVLAEDLREMQADEAAGGYDTAVQRFIDKYGEGVFIYLASKSELVNPGVAPTNEFSKWAREHGGLIERYPMSGAYFGPAGVEFNVDVYNQQLRAGQRVRRTPNERRAEANDIIAKSIFYNAKAQMPDNPTDEQRAWLADIQQELIEQYPGFLLTAESNDTLTQQLDELQRATNDREIQKTDAGEALLLYMGKRDEIIEAQQAQGISPSVLRVTTSDAGTHLRQYLRDVAAELIIEHPEFKRLWDDVLSRELGEDELVEVPSGTAG